MHLYSAAISSITWADIDLFCRQSTAENSFLDYKREFPNDLAKTIAAMANTLGGVILIGVDETNDGKPQLPLLGIPNDRGLEERVLNVVLDNMTPPVIPEIVTCPNEAGDQAIVVIRIPQSENSPHALHRNTSVYIRTGKRNKPEDLAELGRIDWMRNRRRKSEELRERIFDRACVRFGSMRDGRVGGVPATDEGVWIDGTEQPGLLTISMCPTYPERMLARPAELEGLRHKISIPDYFGTDEEFPPQGPGCIKRTVEDGFVMHYSGKSGLRTYHTHLNIYGLYLFRQSLLWKKEEKVPHRIRGNEIFCRLHQVIETAAKFYLQIGYWGPLKFGLRLTGLLGQQLLMPDIEFERYMDVQRSSTDDVIDVSGFLSTSDLNDDPHPPVMSLYERVCWASNHPVSLEQLKKLLVLNKH
jgi:hypothetical protein